MGNFKTKSISTKEEEKIILDGESAPLSPLEEKDKNKNVISTIINDDESIIKNSYDESIIANPNTIDIKNLSRNKNYSSNWQPSTNIPNKFFIQTPGFILKEYTLTDDNNILLNNYIPNEVKQWKNLGIYQDENLTNKISLSTF